VFTAAATFLLIAVGAMVTSNDAGLSVPDWPTSFGSLYRMPPMIGGVKFEHGHRMFAEFIGLLTVILAVWTWRSDRRPWMRMLGMAALATVVIQGILGGVTVLTSLPPVVSTAHAAVGQAFFCIAVAIALFTGRRWSDEVPRTRFDSHRPALLTLAWLSVGAIYLQLILGAMFRHHGMRLLPHVTVAVVVTILILWTVLRTLTQYTEIEQLRQPANILLSLLVVQLGLGFAAYVTRVVWNPNAAQPTGLMVSATVAHVSVGALLLATAVVLAIQATRHIPVLHEQRIRGTQKAVTA
jgi:heme a synthase